MSSAAPAATAAGSDTLAAAEPAAVTVAVSTVDLDTVVTSRAPQPVAQLVAAPVAATSAVSSLLDSGPSEPVESPALWALMAAARRQLEPDTASLTDGNLLRANDETGAGGDDPEISAKSSLFNAEPPEWTVDSSITMGSSPSGVAVNADGTRAYVTNQGAGTVSVIDTASGAVVSTITVGSSPSAVALSPDGTRAYVANRGAGTVSVINTANGAVVTTVKVGVNPTDVAVTPDGTRVFVVNSGAGTVTKIDATTNKVTVAAIKVGNGSSSIAITPDGKYALVTNKTDNTVSVITLSWNGVKTVTGVGTSPTDIVIAANGTTAYIANLDGTVAVATINPTTNTATVSTHLTVGAPANSLALTSDGAVLLVAGTNDTVTAVDTATGGITQTLPTDPTPDTAGLAVIAAGVDGTAYLTDNTDNALRVLTYGVVTPPANQPPTVADPIVGTPNEATGTVTGQIVADDPDDDPLIYTVTSGPASGAVTVDGSGAFSYTPTAAARQAAAAQGATADSFTVTVSDGTDSVDVIVGVAISPAPPQLTLTNTATVGTGTNPSGVAISGGRAYVTNQDAGTVSVIDLATNTVLSTITVGAAPTAVAVNRAGTRVYVTNKTVGTVSVIDTANNSVLTTVKVGTAPSDIVVSPDGTRVFVTNAGAGTVTKIDTATNKVTVTIKVGNGPSSIVLSPNAKYAYVTNKTDGTVSVITLSYNAVKTITGVGTSPTDVIVSPDNATAYIANLDGTVAVINTATNTVTNHLNIGSPANSIALSADGSTLYVAATNDTLAALDTHTGAVTATLTTDPTPDTTSLPVLAIGADGTIYQTDNTDNTLRVITVGTAAPTNQAPAISDVIVGNPSPATGVVTGQIVAHDPDGDTLTYTVTGKPSSGTFTMDSATGAFIYTPSVAARVKAATAGGSNLVTVVVSAGDGTAASDVSFTITIGPATYQRTATIGVGQTPMEVKFSPDGLHAYTINVFDSAVGVIDTATDSLITTIPIGGFPGDIELSPDGTTAYVAVNSNDGRGLITVINTFTNTVGSTIDLGSDIVNGIAISPDGSTAYVARTFSHSVTVVDLTTRTITGSIAVGEGPLTVTFNPGGTRAYVANTQSNTVSVIDTATRSVVATMTTDRYPEHIAISEDGSRGYVSNFLGQGISTFDTATNRVTNVFVGGSNPSDVAVTPDGSLVFVSNSPGLQVSLVDTATNTTLTTVAADMYPDGLALSPDGTKLYVTNVSDGTVSVFTLVHGIPNRAPSAQQLTVNAPDPASGEVGGSFRFADPDGDAFTYAVTGNPTMGTVVIDAAGNFNYAPTAAARHDAAAEPIAPSDFFTITATDPDGASGFVNVSVPISPLNTPPVQNGQPDVDPANAVTGAVTGSLSYTDPDGDSLVYAVTAGPGSGSIELGSTTGIFTYTPYDEARAQAGPDTTDTFTVTVTDGHGGTATSLVNVAVAPSASPQN